MGIASKAKHCRTVWHTVGHHLKMGQHFLRRGILRKRKTTLLSGGANEPAYLFIIQLVPIPDRFFLV